MSTHLRKQHARCRSDDSVTLEEILETAMSFEKAAFDFYTNLIPKVDEELQFLVEGLANEEEEHFELLARLSLNPDIKKEISNRISKPEEQQHFREQSHSPELGSHPDEQTILRYALRNEDTAMRYYWDLAINAEPGLARDLFEYLAYEETSHKRQIEKQYYNSVYKNRSVA